MIQRRQPPQRNPYAETPAFSDILAEFARLMPWADLAACAVSDVDFFQESSAKETLKALEICADCPVRGPCITYAVKANEPVGVWGGATTPERRSALRKHREGADTVLEAGFPKRLALHRRKVAENAERARRGRRKAAQTRQARKTTAA